MKGNARDDEFILNNIKEAYLSKKSSRDILVDLFTRLNNRNTGKNNWCCYSGIKFPIMKFSASKYNDAFKSGAYIFENNNKYIIDLPSNTCELFNYISNQYPTKYILIVLACRNNISTSYDRRSDYNHNSSIKFNQCLIPEPKYDHDTTKHINNMICFANSQYKQNFLIKSIEPVVDPMSMLNLTDSEDESENKSEDEYEIDKTDGDNWKWVKKERKGGKAKTTKWVSTGKRITDKTGKKRTLYECSDKPGELRIRKFVMVKGERRVKYIKCGQKP
jgi:hypothetical protein